jgi:GrpB-like predicted nucleotidyltransferase (UPF0157 family)
MAFNSTLQTMEDPILVADYDADWSLLYEQEKSHIFDALGNTVADIQHIGSTSVPGLAAKPVIDILLGVEHMPPQTGEDCWPRNSRISLLWGARDSRAALLSPPECPTPIKFT